MFCSSMMLPDEGWWNQNSKRKTVNFPGDGSFGETEAPEDGDEKDDKQSGRNGSSTACTHSKQCP